MFVHEGSPSLGSDLIVPNPLDHFHVSNMRSQPSSSSIELDFDVPIDNFEICDFNVDMGYVDNVFNVLGGNLENYESLGYLCGYDAALGLYSIYLEDKPRKIM